MKTGVATVSLLAAALALASPAASDQGAAMVEKLLSLAPAAIVEVAPLAMEALEIQKRAD